MAKILTAQSIERMRPDSAKRLEIPDGALPGLYFIVQLSGAKSFAVRYRAGGKPKKLTLGPYPALDLATARERAREALLAVSAGRDPGAEKIAQRRAAAEEPADRDLVSGVVAEFLRRHVTPNNRPRTAEEVERLFRLHVLPAWGTRRIKDIGRRDVVDLLDGLVDRGTPVAANRSLAAVRKMFNWAVDRGIVDASPAVRIQPPTQEVSRDRVLSDDELRLFWRASDSLGFPFGPMFQLLALTGQRRDEVAQMTRSELSKDGSTWVIPKERAKNGLAHEVPLAPEARAVLASIPRVAGKAGHIFSTNGERPASGYSKAKARLDAKVLELARHAATEQGDDPDEVAIAPWVIHDLRRTAATVIAKIGHPPHVVEAILNHKAGTISGVAAIYNRHGYEKEKRQALQDWASHLKMLR
ncbi:tyrosine-type recombinase/integrase [Salinarimonas soli]|uniref:DUF4102 domain-containing protein n=1 Tax=Salinarimonas soli TaxID=1638099 RepID=A0A5B2VE87_9HYPH|nr:site-specific integrase [Salinarimonas soli]KAA2236946.1 DUF4102 domain-containing protein [Salinarimonas soli]